MPKVRFLAFVKSMTGVSEVDFDDQLITVKQALIKLVELYPQLHDILLDDVPDVNLVLGGRTLLIPKDLDKKFNQELIIAPIIDGG